MTKIQQLLNRANKAYGVEAFVKVAGMRRVVWVNSQGIIDGPYMTYNQFELFLESIGI